MVQLHHSRHDVSLKARLGAKKGVCPTSQYLLETEKKQSSLPLLKVWTMSTQSSRRVFGYVFQISSLLFTVSRQNTGERFFFCLQLTLHFALPLTHSPIETPGICSLTLNALAEDRRCREGWPWEFQIETRLSLPLNHSYTQSCRDVWILRAMSASMLHNYWDYDKAWEFVWVCMRIWMNVGYCVYCHNEHVGTGLTGPESVCMCRDSSSSVIVKERRISLNKLSCKRTVTKPNDPTKIKQGAGQLRVIERQNSISY